jgi:hypothetical protein
MICPFCQYELDIEQMSCSNCGAAFPRTGTAAFGVKLRTLAVSGVLLLFASVILVDCVLNYLPGGPNSSFFARGSPQAALGPSPNMKSPEVQALMQSWANGVQPSQNPPPETKHSRH